MLFKNILVPLDGSHLAEAALPAAIVVAQIMHAKVTLIHIIEKNAPEEIHGEHHLTTPDEAMKYLEKVGASFPAETKIERHVHTEEVSNVARSIASHADELGPDLIILCSHGVGGLRDFLVGSIAQQVIVLGETPVLLIHPPSEASKEPYQVKQILIPVDGDPEHEQVLPLANEFARMFQASAHLLMVVPTMGTLKGKNAATGKLLPVAMAAMLDLSEQDAQGYLSRLADTLKAEGISVAIEVARGDPAAEIAENANRIKAGLIILATHGKRGQGAFWAGSVAPKVCSLTRVPLLLMPVH
jgi:nucleotide-binding universal stress UspA family protein